MGRVLVIAIVAAVAGSALAGAARADHQPMLVVPGKPGVPVIINGRDASWAVVDGDWGLYRAGHGQVSVLYPARVLLGPPVGGYFPHTGRRPRLGRFEIEPPPNRLLPPPAESYHRVWGTQSDPGPVTEYPPFEPPQVIVAPKIRLPTHLKLK